MAMSHWAVISVQFDIAERSVRTMLANSGIAEAFTAAWDDTVHLNQADRELSIFFQERLRLHVMCARGWLWLYLDG